MTSSRKINWTSPNGQPVEVTVEVTKELSSRVADVDGMTVDCGVELFDQTRLTVKVAGVVRGESWGLQAPAPGAPAACVAMIGMVGLTADKRDLVKSALDECTAEVTTPEITAYLADRFAAYQRAADLDRHQAHTHKAVHSL